MGEVGDTYVVHGLDLVSRDGGPVVEHQGRRGNESRDVRQPNFKKSDLYQYQLIVLAQFAETGDAFRELHHPLHAGRDVRRELLPQPASFGFQGLRRRGGHLAPLRTARRQHDRFPHQVASVFLGVGTVGVVGLGHGQDDVVNCQLF